MLVYSNPLQDGLLTVNGIAVSTADIDANNGVIHVMEGLIPPAPSATIGEILASDPR